MKLIDLLVKELPKRGGWPDGALNATQDKDGEVCFSDGAIPEFGLAAWTGGDWCENEFHTITASDYATTIVTREQYESALAASEGWIEWGGGECPADGAVDVKLRNGHVTTNRMADSLDWNHYTPDGEVAIIAYRLHKPDINSRANDDRLEQDLKGGLIGPFNSIKECIAYADKEREQDLNECIGQDVDMPEWHGDGVPPVGIECEVKWTGGKWEKCEVLFVGTEKVVVEMRNREAAMSLCDVKFRPLRTEAGKNRDEAIEFIREIIDAKAGDPFNSARFIYECMMGGNIPGVKLED